MPIMTVTTLEGKKQGDKKKLADELTSCIQEHFHLPRQIIRVIFFEVPSSDYAVAGEFLKEHEGEDDTILRIGIMPGRTPEQKSELINELKAVLENTPAFSSGPIRIIIEENAPENFYRTY